MPRFDPFAGLRYDTGRVDLGSVTAPPYDVIDEDDRRRLVDRDPANIVRVDLPRAESGGDPYAAAAALLEQWRQDGVLVVEDRPVFYGYSMTFTDEAGVERRTRGVLGALELSRPGEGAILPHEHTTPKAKSDRLQLQRACRANLSPIWALSPARGLAAAGEGGTELGMWPDDDGVTHRLWRIDDPDQQREISRLVGGEPVVIADGHHRYETSLAYRDEVGAGPDDPAGAAMMFVVELAEDELTVGPIHRLLRTGGVALEPALAPWFDLEPAVDAITVADLEAKHALGLITRDGTVLLHPRPRLIEASRDLDTSRLDVALADAGITDITFQHGVDNVRRAVADGTADAGVLVRPVGVEQILAIADGGERMPPKTTFFYPKLRTGTVLRLLD